MKHKQSTHTKHYNYSYNYKQAKMFKIIKEIKEQNQTHYKS